MPSVKNVNSVFREPEGRSWWGWRDENGEKRPMVCCDWGVCGKESIKRSCQRYKAGTSLVTYLIFWMKFYLVVKFSINLSPMCFSLFADVEMKGVYIWAKEISFYCSVASTLSSLWWRIEVLVLLNTRSCSCCVGKLSKQLAENKHSFSTNVLFCFHWQFCSLGAQVVCMWVKSRSHQLTPFCLSP